MSRRPSGGDRRRRPPSRESGRADSARAGRRGDQRGLVALDWLLVVAGVVTIAALSVVVVQRAINDALGRDDGTEPSVHEHLADIAAVEIETAAHAALLAYPNNYNDEGFKDACETKLPADFPEVVASAMWDRPEGKEQDPDSFVITVRARCKLMS